MLSLAEYQAYVNDISILGQDTDNQIANNVDDDSSKKDAINTAKEWAKRYQQEFTNIMQNALFDIASNALHHYQTQTGVDLPEDIIKDVIKDQYTHRYYGATLQQRLIVQQLRLNRVVIQTAQTGVNNLGGLFSQPFPFGAQVNISRRLLQGTAIKVEQDVARKVADHVDYPFIRWVLAKQHRVQCQCEDYASATNKDVEAYVRDHQLDIDTKGLYFADDLPDPPHPNCQCEFNLVGSSGEVVPSRGFRPFHRLRRLIRKLLRS